jgi:hypothetical protein
VGLRFVNVPASSQELIEKWIDSQPAPPECGIKSPEQTSRSALQ